jgi:hypothetical protein
MTTAKIKTSAIQNPSPENTVTVQRQMKESIEIGQRLRGDPNDSFVRVRELTQGGLWKLVNGVLVPGTVSSGSSSVTTADSVSGDGSSGSPIILVGDSASPGNSMLYGTNASGTKGWYSQPVGGSSTLAGLSDVAISSPSNGQVLTYNSGTSKWNNAAASGGTWTNVVTNSFASNTTGFTGVAGTWAISGGVLLQSNTSASPNRLKYNTPVPYAAIRIKVDVNLVSSGAGSESVAAIAISDDSSFSSTNMGDIGIRWESSTPHAPAVADEFGIGFLATNNSINWGVQDSWHTIEMQLIGLRHVLYVDGVVALSYVAPSAWNGFQSFGLFSYGSQCKFRNFSLDTLSQ